MCVDFITISSLFWLRSETLEVHEIKFKFIFGIIDRLSKSITGEHYYRTPPPYPNPALKVNMQIFTVIKKFLTGALNLKDQSHEMKIFYELF